MLNYGPEEFKLNNGKRVVIKSWDTSQGPQLEEALDQFSKERAYAIQKNEAHLLVEEIGERWSALLSSNSNVFLGVYDENRMIAYLTLRKLFPDRPWEKHIGECGLMILQEYWSQGLGTRLLEIAETLAKQVGINRLEAKVRVKNQKASNLFIRNKYQIEGKRNKAAYINNMYEDEYYLAKILD